MSLILISNATAIARNVSMPFQGVGGTEPYTYSIVSGGGTIDASTGVFKASGSYGNTTVQVTDNVSATAIKVISILSYETLVCDIIRSQLGLGVDRVWLFDQKKTMPKDLNLFVVVQVQNCKPFGNTFEASPDGVTSVQSINFLSTLSVDMMSRNTEALDRKEELLMALNSQYARQQQTTNAFSIANVSSNFNNLSELDGAAIPYRFNISFNIQYTFKKISGIQYYDNFDEFELFTSDGGDFLVSQTEDSITDQSGDPV